ncbi:MAG: hypothetical protein LJE84_13585 [Gammaproteobacteria bacterium]|nr:hypothetical protein [Gammaproteobacteria bacterium]
MKTAKQRDEVVRNMDPRRRSAVRRLIGTGFALPVVVSMAASTLPIQEAHAQSAPTPGPAPGP